jgi:hypothetical protein
MTLESCMANCTGSDYWGTEYRQPDRALCYHRNQDFFGGSLADGDTCEKAYCGSL